MESQLCQYYTKLPITKQPHETRNQFKKRVQFLNNSVGTNCTCNWWKRYDKELEWKSLSDFSGHKLCKKQQIDGAAGLWMYLSYEI